MVHVRRQVWKEPLHSTHVGQGGQRPRTLNRKANEMVYNQLVTALGRREGRVSWRPMLEAQVSPISAAEKLSVATS